MPAASGLPSPGSASGGQGHEIEVAIPDGALDAGRAARLVAAFEADYARLFGRIVPGMALEVMNWSVRVSTPPEAPPRAGDCESHNAPEPAGTRTLTLGQAGETTVAACFRRSDLAPGDTLASPALIVEPQTTTFVSARFEARIDTVRIPVQADHRFRCNPITDSGPKPITLRHNHRFAPTGDRLDRIR